MEDVANHRPNASGGPQTPAGKARSRENAITHGCRSRTLILKGENLSDFEALYDRWMAFYQPDNDAYASLVEELILNKWFYERTLRNFIAVEEEFARFDFLALTAEQHKKFELALRYKNTAERAADRSLRAVEALRKQRYQEMKDVFREYDRLQQMRDGFIQRWFRHEIAYSKLIIRAKKHKIDATEMEAELEQDRQRRLEIQELFTREPVPFASS